MNEYPAGLSDEEKNLFDQGWSAASASLAVIWEGYKMESSSESEAYKGFDRFMNMVSLKLQGASNQDLAEVAVLNGYPEMASMPLED